MWLFIKRSDNIFEIFVVHHQIFSGRFSFFVLLHINIYGRTDSVWIWLTLP